MGTNGRISDGVVYVASDLYPAIEQNLMNLPEDKALPGILYPVPHIIVADSAFALSPNLIKPYPQRYINQQQRVYNYRLSRARRVVENVFGIMANQFRVLINIIPLNPNKAIIITQACCVADNFLRSELHLQYLGAKLEQEINPRYTFIYGLPRLHRRLSNDALQICDELLQYFNGVGAVPWQNQLEI